MTDFKKLLVEANMIDGAWVGADSGQTIDVHNPANGNVIGTVPNCGASETDRAIEAAKKMPSPTLGKAICHNGLGFCKICMMR